MTNIGEDPQDRGIGEYWEDRFCDIAHTYGWEAWPFRRGEGATFTDSAGNHFICPDVWMLRSGGRQYACEIKHKMQARNGCYGFEKYRADSLLALEEEYEGVTVLYVVHNWAKAGGKNIRENRESDWHAQLLHVCEGNKTVSQSRTLYAGKVTEEPVVIHYYCDPFRAFQPLAYFLEGCGALGRPCLEKV